MKINEFQIFKYGPIKNFAVSKLKGFNLFWGWNEAGKSLIIDALVKFLVKNSDSFNFIDRIDHQPEGYLNISLDNDQEVKLPEQKEKFQELVDIEDREYRDFFIIRNSDLEMGRQKDIIKKEEELKDIVFATTDKLTGLKTEKIKKLCDQLNEMGRLTPGGDLKNISGEKLKERYNQGQELLKGISKFFQDIKSYNLDELDHKWMYLNKQYQVNQENLQRIKNLYKKLQYNKSNISLAIVKRSLMEIEKLKEVNLDKEKEWLKLNLKLNNLLKQKEDLEIQKQEIINELTEIKQKFNLTQDKLIKLKIPKDKIDRELKPLIFLYQDQLVDYYSKRNLFKFLNFAGLSSLFLMTASLVGNILKPQGMFFILILIFLFITSIITVFVISRKLARVKLDKKLSELISQANNLNIEGEDIEQINLQIEQFDLDFDQLNHDFQKQSAVLENCQKEHENLTQEKIPGLEEKIWDCRTTIEEIKTTVQVENIEQYTQQVQQKQKHQDLLEKNIGILESILHKNSDNREENIDYWETEIAELRPYAENYPNLEYSRTEEISYENLIDQQQQEISELKQKIKELDNKFREIATVANQILKPDISRVCNSVEDLKAIESEVRKFIENIDERRENILTVIDILKVIDKQEREKVSRLFEDESKIFKHFNSITDNLYTGLTFNSDTLEMQIYKGDKVLSPFQLSGGAYDQLYFSIRLAFGELLMKSNPGFFILDDPFIKSDQVRLDRQFKMLFKIVDLGWQVFYFSCKSEIKKLFKSGYANNNCKLVEIKNIK